ncbi:MAG: hypothetical protein P1U87_10525 [Verrucomicrobiales bacterium]|nr:hypothetical protein [Verrucomicrobiales bacterium]
MRSSWIVILLGLFLPISGEAGERRFVSEFFQLPPAMEEFYGNLTVRQISGREGAPGKVVIRGAGDYQPKRGIISPRRSARLVVSAVPGFSSEQIRDVISEALLSDFYKKVISEKVKSWHEKRLELVELIPLTRDEFVERGGRRLRGKSSGVARFDAWWTIRMGLRQTVDPSHHLVLICLKMDYDGTKSSFGHFCFGLRKRGGAADLDTVFDFRAPWYEDRLPTLLEGMNYGNKLQPLYGYTENLYDWIYTQTSYRHCYVQMWFLPVSHEQLTLLRYFDREIEAHDAGHFKGLRKNCASLGMAFLDRLERVSEPISLGRGLADIPTQTVKKLLKESGGNYPFYQIENNTHESGRVATAKSEIHRAQPSRGSSRSFLALRNVEGIN